MSKIWYSFILLFFCSSCVGYKQTAKSSKDSKFESDGTEIISEGFRLIEQGNIILFQGKTSVLLTQ